MTRRSDYCAPRSFPADLRRYVEIDVDTLAIVEIDVDAIVGRHLRQGSQAARPFVGMETLRGVKCVVGIIKTVGVLFERLRTQNISEDLIHWQK